MTTPKKVVFQGEPGANSHLAIHEAYANCEAVPCATFEDAFTAVTSGDCDLAMIPIENSVAGRVADFLDFGIMMCLDALTREESCGGHFREEYQTADGEALRNDDQFAYVGAWEWTGESGQQRLNKEELAFENVKLAQRSYK